MERFLEKRRFGAVETTSESDSEFEATCSTVNSPLKKKKKSYKQKYIPQWEQQFIWLKEFEGSPFCKVCGSKINGGITHLKRHELSNGHKKRLKSAQKQPNLQTFFKNDNKLGLEKQAKVAELKALAFIMEHNLPISLLDHFTPLCKSMFPDSQIAQSMALGRTKGSGLLINAFKKEYFDLIVEDLKKYPFSLIIDETTDVSTAKSLAIVARYCKGDCIVRDNFFTILQVKFADAENISATVINLIKSNNIPGDNFIGFGADNAAVMMGTTKDIKPMGLMSLGTTSGVGIRLKKELNNKLFTMGCVCHSFNLCSLKACEGLPRSIEEFVRDISNYFSNSSKRIEALQEFQEFTLTVNHRMLRLCSTRWLSMQSVVSRILEQWNALKLFFIAEVSEESSLHKAKAILDGLNNPIIEIYLNFLSYILKIINDMNLEFQSEETRIFSLAPRIMELYKLILKSFIKKSVLANTNVSNISVTNPDNFLSLDDIYVGAKANNLIYQGKVQEKDIKSFKIKALAFYKTLCQQICKRFEFDSAILNFTSNFDPQKIKKDEFINSISQAEFLFPTLVPDVEQLDVEWRMLEEIKEIKNISPDSRFWHNVISMKNALNLPLFPNLNKLLNGIMALPHSSAAAERIFSQLSLIKTKSRNKLYISTCDALLSGKGLLRPLTCYQYCPSESILKKKWKPFDSSKNDCDNEIIVPDISLPE